MAKSYLNDNIIINREFQYVWLGRILIIWGRAWLIASYNDYKLVWSVKFGGQS